MTTKTRLGVAAIAASLAFVLAACSGGSPSGAATSGTTSGTTTARSTGSPASISASASATATFNDADVAFAQMMIVHHQGAIQMADLAPSRAQNQDVLALAARIKAAQAPEIDQMTSWLTAWGAAPSMMSGSTTSGTGGMDHGGMGGATSAAGSSMSMPGMMSGDQMQQLESASGAAFDKMFLELMIVHHQGAIEMAETEIADGSNPEAVALAQKIKSDQTAEIAEIQALLQTL
jgi:uncharacterized protein (DUF305 family)